MERFRDRPLLADFSLIQLHLKREAAPMDASQNSTDGPRPKGDGQSCGKRTFSVQVQPAAKTASF